LADRSAEGLESLPHAGHEILTLDVAEAEACAAACEGVDIVIHLAADPSPEADWESSLLANNVQGVVNVLRAASEAGCRRVVFASSVHAVGGYPPETSIADNAPPRPTNLYGASKAFGESVAATYAATGLSGIAIRIGAYDAPWFHAEGDARAASAYISVRDMNQLLVRCIKTPDIDYAVVAGISDNRHKRFDLVLTRALLGYAPHDDGFAVLGLTGDPSPT
jgi:nucleoside-diphosphate-sugar epimerase